jgi:hypothetical protein
MYSSTLSLTSALDEGWWSTPPPGALPSGKRPSTRYIRGWVGLTAGLNGRRKFRPLLIRSPDHPASSEETSPKDVRIDFMRTAKLKTVMVWDRV